MEPQFLGAGESSSTSEGFSGTEVSDELDHVPLLRRRRYLLANPQRSDSNGCRGNENPLTFGVVKEEEDNGSNSLDVPPLTPACSSREAEVFHGASCNTHVQMSDVQGLRNENKSLDVVQTFRDCLGDLPEQIKCEDLDENSLIDKLDGRIFKSPPTSVLLELEVPLKVKVESSNEELLRSESCDIDSSSGADVLITTIKDEVCGYEDEDQLDHIVLKERLRMMLSRKHLDSAKPVQEASFNEVAVGPMQIDADEKTHPVTRAPYADEKTRPVTQAPLIDKDTKNVSPTSSSFKVKDEPSNDRNCHNLGMDSSLSTSSMNMKGEISKEFDDDEEENMCLGDRLKRQRSLGDSEHNGPRNFAFLNKSVPSYMNSSPIAPENATKFSINRARKRKKTATFSVATAMEEDAPGLLQELVEKGVLVDEIKLYGEMDNDDSDESSIEESFSELGSVLSKIFTHDQSFLKFAPIRFGKGARASYCLACLLSLVEQARYVQFREWPVEWGWCRDIRSFIFVFERHNRIVLERPEYGYATYFFQLVDSLPIEWQIKRLVTAMKLTSCSRISLIENKALLVGEDLSEGEAKVLSGYGWVPNSGLATMLNYCDRVVHDRQNEKDTSEWRSKIGKLLMDGFNGGTLIATNIPEKAMKFGKDSQNTQVKLEL